MNSFRQRIAGLMATLAIVGIVIVLPLVLLAAGGNPLPHSMPSGEALRAALTSPDDGTMALTIIKIVAWAAWAFLTLSIALEILARARGIRAPRLPGLHMPQSAAKGLVGTALLLFTASPIVAQAATAAPLPTHHVAAASATAGAAHQSTETAPAAAQSHQQQSAATKQNTPTITYTVQRGDSLWSIARQHLGSGERYTEVAALNHDVLGDHPGFLQPGWVLHVPDDNATSGADEHTVTVQEGDTLSAIAEHELGSAEQVPAIVKATQQTTQPGGLHLNNPNMIRPGWKIVIPATTGPAGQPGKPTVTHHDPTKPTPAQRATPAPETHQDSEGTQRGGGESDNPTTAPTVPAPAPHSAQPDAPSADSTPRDDQAQAAPATTQQGSIAPWMLTGLTGAGAVLAGGLWMGLRRRRAAQFRSRRPGKTIATPDAELAPVEKSIETLGAQAAPMVTQIDAALRHLAAETHGSPMPAVAAVQWTTEQLAVHLSEPCALPHPWAGSADDLHWTITAEQANDLVLGRDLDDPHPAPLPMLVTVGTGDHDDTWLVNIEDFGAITIAGDTERGRDFVRYLVAELAVNQWSEDARVDCVGIGDELNAINPARVRSHDMDQQADTAAEALADAIATMEQGEGSNVTTARAHRDGDDAWQSRILVIDLDGQQPSEQLRQLLHFLGDHPGQTGTAVLLNRNADPEEDDGSIRLHVDDEGRVTMPAAGLALTAVRLTHDEARGCALVLGQADATDIEIPVEDDADGWRAFVDEAGGLRDEYALARDVETEDAHSVLPDDDDQYIARAATTPEDLAALAPKVTGTVRDELHEADPQLDADVRAWFSDQCAQPRLTLLGPVSARTRGDAIAVAKRKPYYTELLTYLVTRRHGATPAQLAEAFNIADGTVRRDVKTVREWLGTDPATGHKHLPGAKDSEAAKARGVGVYQVSGVLVDADLFRRLRARGETRGSEGIADLRRALTLVSGIPFDQLRPGGWSWLYEGDRLDHHMLCGIVDVAHMVTTDALRSGDIARARAAAETAALAAPHEEIPRLDLAAVAAAEGHDAEAERMLRREVVNRSDDGLPPIELSERTETIIRNRNWLNPDKAAS